MSAQNFLLLVVCSLLIAFLFNACPTEGRYLPTRANNDRLDKLKELLKELLETEIEKEEYQPDGPLRWHPETKLFYKRDPEIPPQ